jgi:hypothetical protein
MVWDVWCVGVSSALAGVGVTPAEATRVADAAAAAVFLQASTSLDMRERENREPGVVPNSRGAVALASYSLEGSVALARHTTWDSWGSMTSTDEIEVKAVSVAPNECELTQPIHLQITFTTHKHIPHAHWRLSFLADTAHARKIVRLGQTPHTEYAVGTHTMQYDASTDAVAQLQHHVLANVGLLLLHLYSADDEVLQVSMVTQVAADSDGKLTRCVFNPLE